MRKILLITFVALNLAGCTKQRNLYNISSPLLYIESDWLPSLGVADMSGNATAALYKGGSLESKSFFSMPASTRAKVSRGDYGVLVFNGQMFSEERTNLDFISFRNTVDASLFEAYSVRATAVGRLPLGDGEILINNEMAMLASAYCEKYIADDPVFFRVYEDGGIESELYADHVVDSVALTPVSLSHYAQVFVDLINPASAAVAHGELRGFAESVYVKSRMPSHTPGVHQMSLNNLRMTGDKKGTVESSKFVTFGPPLDLPSGRAYTFRLSVLLHDGETFEQTFDVTDQVLPAVDVILSNRAGGIYGPSTIVIRISAELPVVKSGINIGTNPWSDDEVIIIKVT